VFRVLVAELDRRVDAGRAAVRGAEPVAVHPVSDEGLRVEGAGEIPAFVVTVVERLEVDVLGFGLGLDELGEIAEADAGPGGDRGPALDAVVVHALGP